MKKSWAILMATALLIWSATGCLQGSGAKVISPHATETESTEALRVVTSFYPMYDFTAKIGGELITLSNMVPPGSEAHGWEPTAQDIVALEEADVFIYNGAGMEHWVEDVLEALSNDALMVLETAEGLELLENHGHHDHGHDHDHEHGEFDPHVWLDPLLAKQQMEGIAETLATADPENAATYQANYEHHAASFDALNAEFQEGLADAPRRDIVVTHEAFGYLAHRYDLNQLGIMGLVPDSEPDPATMIEIIEFVDEHDVQVIFFEEATSPAVAEVIAAESGATTDVLNPIESLTPEQEAAGMDYLDVMRQNLEALKRALHD